MFQTWPINATTDRIKQQLLEIMEDKYQELIDQGKSNHEAIGQVISEFGNIEELRQELEPDDVYVNADEVPIGQMVQDRNRQRSWQRILDDSYWVVVVLVYMLVSFLTGWWHLTWLIFLIAVVLESLIRNLLGLPEED